MSTIILYPNQLYENINVLHKYKTIYLVEHPYYFDMRVNKIKIAYMRACMQCYYDKLKKENINVKYVDYKSRIPDTNIMYDTTDHRLNKLNTLESPNFLMTMSELSTYKGAVQFASFYNFVKNKLNILTNVPNMDIYNRKVPKRLLTDELVRYKSLYYNKAIEYSSQFKGIGNPNNVNVYPINSIDAYKVYKKFLKTRIHHFGDYQDYIQSDTVVMYHSCISAALNIGLLNPHKLLKLILRTKCTMNNKEGFIRQLIWREYMRYLYMFHYDELINSNLPNNQKYFSNDAWYTASTGIHILDTEITKAIEYGYAHHIVRLMIFMNYLILSQIHPRQIYEWFMNVVSIDAYEWVMVSNIYGMGHFSNIGVKRPYLCSTNYINKMSNYKRDIKWDKLFHSFVNTRKKYAAYYLRNVKR